MLFKAKSHQRMFFIDIQESYKAWTLCIKEGEQSKEYQIMKKDYQKIGDVIHFLVKNTSYTAGVIHKNSQHFVNLQSVYREFTLYNEDILLQQSLKKGGLSKDTSTLVANMPGKIIDILVQPKDQVVEGQPLLLIEAMKMENEIRSPCNTSIASIKVKKGDNVETGAVLVVFANN